MICCQPPPPYGCGGFQKECRDKYDDLIFSMIVEVFRYLPIVHTSKSATVAYAGNMLLHPFPRPLSAPFPLTVDGKVMVVHGGLFGRPGVTLADLAEIDRLDYCPAPPPEPEPSTPEEERAQDLRQLMRDCLCECPSPFQAAPPLRTRTALLVNHAPPRSCPCTRVRPQGQPGVRVQQHAAAGPVVRPGRDGGLLIGEQIAYGREVTRVVSLGKLPLFSSSSSSSSDCAFRLTSDF